MEEIVKIREKYNEAYVKDFIESSLSIEELNRYATTYYKDVAEIFDCITRIRNIERNPSGYSLDDAPILGLLTRIWKLLKEVIYYYEKDNAEILGILERPLIEAAIIATYLLNNSNEVIEDFRKCSYKDRLRILRDYNEGSEFFETKAGKRLLKSVKEKMAFEGYSEDDFRVQKRNRWKLQGKSFYDIFKSVMHEKMYRYTYGMMSESIHCSWNEIMDFCLFKNDDGTFSINPLFCEADIRFVSPLVIFCLPSYKLWLQRIDIQDKYLDNTLIWIEKFNEVLFCKFDKLYG